MPRWPGFVGASYPAQAQTADVEETINFFVERAEAEHAQAPAALLSTPGFSAFTQPIAGVSIADIGTRGGINANGRVLCVIGPGYYEVFADGTWTKRNGAILFAQDNNPATLAYNGLAGGHVVISAGGKAYCHVLATNVITQVLADESTITMVAFANGRFLAFNALTGHVRMSALNDGTAAAWDPNLFFSNSTFPDPWQAMFVDGQSLIWLPGTEHYQAWSVTQDATNPFAPLSGLTGNYGIASPFGWTLAGNQVMWLAANHEGGGQIITAQAGGRKISNYAVDTAITGFERNARISDCEAFSHQVQGHTHAVWAFPSAMGTPSTTPTWSLDVDQQSWTRRGKWNPNNNRYDLWAPRVHLYAFGKHLVGDRTTGTISAMDPTVGTELDGTAIRRLRRAPARTREFRRDPLSVLQLVMDTGVGAAVGADQDVNPRAMLRVSEDAGRTWSNERQAAFGRIGQTRRRVYWTRLGAPPDAGIEVSFATKVPVRIVDAYLNPTEQEALAA